MNTLNNDIYQYIFLLLPISDKRSFIRTCKSIYPLSMHMPLVEREFYAMINNTKFFYNQYYGLYYPLYKYSIELLYDDHDIPGKYIIPENRILHQFPKIYKKLGERSNLNLIKKILLLSCNNKNGKAMMRGAAKVGNVDILEWMIKNNYERHYIAVLGAISGNKIDVLKWLLDNGWNQIQFAVSHAAKKGHIDIVKFLVNRHWQTSDAPYWAATRGHVDTVKYLYSVSGETIKFAANGAAYSGNLDLLKYALNQGERLGSIYCCTHIHIYEWLIENNLFEYDVRIAQYVAHYGNLECLQYLYSKKYNIINKVVFTAAVVSRNIELIKWLHDLNCPFDESVFGAAISTPSNTDKTLVILKLLISWGCELPDDICSVAAQTGDLETLKFLHAQGCSLKIHTLMIAVANGHLHILIWCRQQGCKWDVTVCEQAVLHYHFDVLKWLRGIDRDICELKSDETEICPWNERVCIYAIKSGHIDVLKFALENGCEIGDACFDAAVKYNDSEMNDLVNRYYVKT